MRNVCYTLIYIIRKKGSAMKKIAAIATLIAIAGCSSPSYYVPSSNYHRRDTIKETAEMQRWIVESPHYQAGGSSFVDYTK